MAFMLQADQSVFISGPIVIKQNKKTLCMGYTQIPVFMCQAKAEMNIEATQLGRKETGFALRTLLTFMLLLVYKPLC